MQENAVISSERSESRNLAVVVAVSPVAQRDPLGSLRSLGVTAREGPCQKILAYQSAMDGQWLLELPQRLGRILGLVGP